MKEIIFIKAQPRTLFILLVVMTFAFTGVTKSQPYPYSEVITEIFFGDPEKYTESRAGDNWPVTWADDDHLYSAWGDGQGPDHPNGTRVSMGWVRVEGNPPHVKVIDTYSNQKETGSGRFGHKASGMLIIDSVIYMWIRNDNKSGEHSRLWWSTDNAVTWNQTKWNFPEFGYITFINFGKNYNGARDNYVYSVSPDTLDAYVHADDYILMRVPKNEVTERSRYEFLSGFDDNGSPTWSYDISERKSVFHHPERCNRSGITYNPKLDRYLWWHGGWPSPIDGEDTRFNPAPLGIYEAPEPWGPWRTVYYNESFESPGEAGSFPTKWMGTVHDGKQSIYMLTSHDDAFTLWPVTLGLSEAKPPYPESAVIKGIEIDWSTHQRHAPGSDNFQLTWSDDGHQYGVWGDGGGFNGTNSKYRVSFGVARIEGEYDNYVGYDRYGHRESSEFEAKTIGKSWAIISLNGNLYSWVHPDGPRWGNWEAHHSESRLYVSKDKSASWQPADWAFTQDDDLIGGAILQFGKDYSGARDKYVYHYLVQPNFALKNNVITELQVPGRIFLLRVKKNRLLKRNAYEFFSGITNGKPSWTRDVNKKIPVFEDENGVGTPMAVSYNPVLKRYLLTTEHSKSESGMIGIFDAPEPWGPWSTVTYASDWTWFGHDNSEAVPANCFFWCFPTKWIGEDGRSVTMVFTGAGRGRNNDSFNTVRVKLLEN